MTTITRRLTFCAGHRVMGHEGKCKHLHGHNYVALIEVAADELDGLGRVIDFSVIKYVVGKWIDETWDHGFLVNKHDDEVRSALAFFTDTPFYLFVGNPTAENIAKELFEVAGRLLSEHGVTVTAVTIEETENCSATYRPEKLIPATKKERDAMITEVIQTINEHAKETYGIQK